jgi:hypothetical protein
MHKWGIDRPNWIFDNIENSIEPLKDLNANSKLT